MSGQGVSKQQDGLYTGYFLMNEKHGHAIYQWDDGSKYEGDWANDKREGSGIFTSKEGSVYEGEWNND